MNLYQTVIYKSRYSKWLDDQGRRESYDETVDRYLNHIYRKALEHNYNVPEQLKFDLRHAILERDVLPSMRGFMTAGKALERDEAAIYNCSFVAIDKPFAFAEIFFTLMLGSGVGFSVERKYVDRLPVIPELFSEDDFIFQVPDSKEGWADALLHALERLYIGIIPKFNYDLVRPAGEKLKTFGGRASGPAPLKSMLEFVTLKIFDAAGRKLTTLEAHDIACKIAEITVVGGVRRSALISLSDLDDTDMRDAKSGEWWVKNPQRALANNSAVYDGQVSKDVFKREWDALAASGSGERGIFNKRAAKLKAEALGRNLGDDFGVNPCGEILLRNREFCNLTSVTIRETDSFYDIKNKVELAAILGTFQSLFDDYRYIGPEWSMNQKEERLLGVSLSGIVDSPLTNGSREDLGEILDALRITAHEANYFMADALGINPAKAITCVKPEGTTSQLVGASSGIHPAYAKQYVRRIRMDSKDPMSQFMIDQGMSYEKDFYNASAYVFSFPIKSSDAAITRHDMTAIKQLELYLTYQTFWCDHNASNTVYVGPDEWELVGDWVYEHFNEICGVSFLPKDNGTYTQAPYEEISADQYEYLHEKSVKVLDWDVMSLYERMDMTNGSQTLACSAGGCEEVITTENGEIAVLTEAELVLS